MPRTTLSVLVGLLFVPVAGSAPKLKDVPAPVYFPTTVGDRWVTEYKYPTSTAEVTEVVTAVETKEGVTVVTIARQVNGAVDPDVSQMRVSDKGLFRVSNLGTVFDAPYCVLKRPLKPGMTWTSEVIRAGTTSTTFKYTAAKEEDVEVPAGKFRAYRLDVEYERGGEAKKSSIWYAPKVGVVRHEVFDPVSGYVKVLKSFTPGK
jgi:hypothetical protein